MELFQPVFTVLTPLPGTDLYDQNYGRFAIRDYDFFDFTHSILPTRLPRKEFYRLYAQLYIKSYSFKRYFQGILRNLTVMRRSSKRWKLPHPDRIPFLPLVMVHAAAVPMFLKVRRRHKTEPYVKD